MFGSSPVAQLRTADEEEDFQATRRWLVSPPPMQQQKTQILLFSLLAFIGASLISNSGASAIEIATLIGVILFHELGHMIAMRIVGYRDVRIFFIPFFGGAAAGTKRGVARWKEGIVLLCGPLPGIVLGTVLAATGEGELMRVIALQLIVVNAINLLPIAPLDGGQLFQVLLFSRQRHLELVFVGVTAALLAIGGLLAGLWVLGIVGFFILVSVPQKKRVLDIAHQVRGRGLPSDPAALDDEQARELYRDAMAALPAEWRERWAGKPQPKAQMLEQVIERATQRPPGAGATAGLLVIWLVTFAVAFAGLFFAIGPSWRSYTNQEAGFVVELPGPPAVKDEAGYHTVTARVGSREYSVLWNDVLEPDAWPTAVHDGLAQQYKVTDLATSANERTFTYREGERFVLVRLVATPRGRVYMIGAVSANDERDAHRFVDSFRVLAP